MSLTKKNFILTTVSIVSIFFVLSMVSGCKQSLSPVESIQVEISQSKWSLSFATSSGTVDVVLQGADLDKIDLNSIRMKGDNPSVSPASSVSAAFQGNSVVAAFVKNQVFRLLQNPGKGTTHRLRIIFRMTTSGDTMEIPTEITVTDEPDQKIDISLLSLEIDPTEWSMNFDKSSGTVEAFIRGEGIDLIDLTSIKMKGDNSAVEPISAISASINNNQIHARFAMNQVLDILLNPAPGSTHTIIVTFVETGSTQLLELSAQIAIEDDDDDGEDPIDPSDLTLEIDPTEWSMNFDKSSGTVEAFIRGDGIDQIDLNSIKMKGDNSAVEPISAISASINNNQVHARFAKNQVLSILLNPEPGSTHTITIIFIDTVTGQEVQLTAQITIEDDDDGDDDDPIDPSLLTLEIVPSQWNMNYSKSSGQVKAFIRGEGIDKIDLQSIRLKGDNSSAQPLAALSPSLQGNHVQAEFPKNQVLTLLLNPAAGSSHTVTVTFLQTGGGQVELSTTVSIVGN